MHFNSLPTCSQGWEEGACPGILFDVLLKAEQCGFLELCLLCDCILFLKRAGNSSLPRAPAHSCLSPPKGRASFPSDPFASFYTCLSPMPAIDLLSQLQTHPSLPCLVILEPDPVKVFFACWSNDRLRQ